MRVLLDLVAMLSCAAQSKLEFEVATIEPSPPPGDAIRVGCIGGPYSGDPTRLRCSNTDLAFLIGLAFGLRSWEFKEPTWMHDEKFEVIASVPQGTTREEFQVMFQNLVEQRFHLAYHRMDERVQGYELVVAKGGSKLAPSRGAPEDSQQSAPKLAKDGYPVVHGSGESFMDNRARMRYPGQTMDRFAQVVSRRMGGPVMNHTGLDGKFDISVYWVTRASDDDGPTFLYALQSQLGLKLEAKKVPASVFVVDHADKMPAAN